MKDLKYYQDKCERLEKVITMRECQLRCACDGLESIDKEFATMDNVMERHAARTTLEAVDAIYELHHGEKIADGFLEPKPRG